MITQSMETQIIVIFTFLIGARPFIPQLLAILILEQLSSAFLAVAIRGDKDEFHSRFYNRRWLSRIQAVSYTHLRAHET